MVTSPHGLFLHGLPVDQLSNEDLCTFACSLADATRLAVMENEDIATIDAWVRHWMRAEIERSRRGMKVNRLFEVVC